MALSTGTVSNAGTSFSFPSGTSIYGAKVLSAPWMDSMERDTTLQSSNDGSGNVVYGQREFANRRDAQNFTIGLLEVTGHSSLYDDAQAGTQRTFHFIGKARQFVGVAWIKSIQPNDADIDSPDSVKLVVTFVPVGKIAHANV
jgi:hypothetical protein